MTPNNTGKTEPCTQISSNCVLWQGPDISCINLCHGDTISDTVSKLATKLCDHIAASCTCNPTLAIDIKCITGVSDVTNLDQVVQGIIDYVCALTPGGSASLPSINLCKNLQYTDGAGNLITSLPLDQFALLLGNEICTILNDIAVIQNDITNIFSRLTVLEDCVLPCTPAEAADFLLTSSCLFSGQQVKVSTLVLALETQFCALRTATGDPTAINNAINAQCLFGTDLQLSTGVSYGSLSDWKSNPANLADSHINQWLVICDLYNAVKSIQENCCDSGCATTTFAYAYTIQETLGVATGINFNFTTSSIPTGFSDCGSIITITDKNGATVTQAFDAFILQSDSAGITVTITSLDVTASLQVQVQFCVSDSANTCQEVQNQTIPLGIACPTDFAIGTPITNTSIPVQWTNGLGTTVTYTVTATDVGTGATAASIVVTSPGVSVSEVISGLSPGTTYNFTLTITTSSGLSQTCPSITGSTTGVSCTTITTTTVAAGVGSPDADWIYLGYNSTGPVEYYYDPVANQVVPVNRSVTPVDIRTAFDGGGATDPSVSAGGVVNFDISTGGMTALDTITASYSTDGITFVTASSVSGSGIANPFNFNFATGVTSGKLYVRVQVENGGSKSPYAEFVWDFDSSLFIRSAGPLTNVLGTPGGSTYPNGLDTESTSLTCGSSVFNTGNKVNFYYIRPFINSGITYYVYVSFTETGAVGRVALCCGVPAILGSDNLTNNEQKYIPFGLSGTYDIDFIVEGAPTFTVPTPPVSGTLVDNGTTNSFGENRKPLSRRYTYTHDGVSDRSDRFGVVLTNSAGTTTTSRNYQVQVVPQAYTGLAGTAKNIYAFIDTTSYTVSRGTALINGLTAWSTEYASTCSWTGNLYIIPVQDNKWLGYVKAIVDDGTSATLDPAAAWVALRALPTSWTGGAAVPITGVLMLAFSNESHSEYHSNTLVAGFTGGTTQPSATYLTNYDEYNDAITGSAVSTWGASQSFGGTSPFTAGFSALYYPTTGGVAGSEAAALLQGLGSYYARMIDSFEYGVKTHVDVTAYLQSGVTPSASNPYQSSKTGGGTPVNGLLKKKWLMMLNQGYTAPADWDFASVRFKNDMTAAANKGTGGPCPSTP